MFVCFWFLLSSPLTLFSSIPTHMGHTSAAYPHKQGLSSSVPFLLGLSSVCVPFSFIGFYHYSLIPESPNQRICYHALSGAPPFHYSRTLFFSLSCFPSFRSIRLAWTLNKISCDLIPCPKIGSQLRIKL